MEAKSKQRNLRVHELPQQYRGLKYPVLLGNTPRVSAIRTHRDKEFLKSNDGKMSKLQHIIG